MNIENLFAITMTHQYAGEFMFTALNFNHENLYNQSIKDDDKDIKVTIGLAFQAIYLMI